MKSVAKRMADARIEIVRSVNLAMQKNELPAYIIESIVADVLGDIRQTAKIELLNEMEQEYGNLDKGIQQSKLAEQTVNSKPDQCAKS